jgi:DNA-binding GntR family transcriptional regulator
VSIAGDPRKRTEPAVSRLRRDILNGRYAPGQRLVEIELSELYHVSRGFLRSALVELAHEGLVERIANQGARVRVVSSQEAIEITEVRLVVEGLCAAKAAEHATEEEMAGLERIAVDMKHAVATSNLTRYSELNSELHDAVRQISRQPVAATILEHLRARNVHHQFRLALRPGRPQVSLPEHLAIIDAICAHDPDAATLAIRMHLHSVIDTLRESAD